MAFPLNPESLALRDRAIFYLGITREQLAMAPQITPQLRAITRTLRRAGQLKVTKRVVSEDRTARIEEDTKHTSPYSAAVDLIVSWPHYLSSSDHADAKKVLLAYHGLHRELRNELHPGHKYLGYQHQPLPIEYFCVAASVSPLSILGILVGEIVRQGAQANTIIAAVNQPRIVQKSVEMALTDEGIDDRMLLGKATGFLPSPRGAQTNVTVLTSANASAATPVAVIAPPPEATIRRAVDRFNDARTIPSLPPAPNLPDFIPPSAVAIEVSDDEGDEDLR